MIEINLLPSEKGLSEQERQLRLFLTLAALVLGAIVGLISVASVMTNLLLEAQSRDLQRKKATLEEAYKAQGELVKELQTIKDKVAVISIVQNSQGDISRITASLLDLFGQNSQVTSAKLYGSGRADTAVTFPNLQSFGQFMDRLNKQPSPFRNVKFITLGQNDYGGVDLKMSFIYQSKL